MPRKKSATPAAADDDEAPRANETARERFLRLAPKRVQRALKAIQLIGNLGGSNYDSSEHERAKIIAALDDAVEDVGRRIAPKEAKPEFKF